MHHVPPISPPQWFTGNLNNLIVNAIKKALPGLLDDVITKQGNAFLPNLVLSQTIDKYVKTTVIIHIKESYRYLREAEMCSPVTLTVYISLIHMW